MPKSSFWLIVFALLLLGQPLIAQTPLTGDHAWQVFLERDIDATGTDRLIFIDTLTGDEVRSEVFGERYTPIGQSVMFYNPAQRRVMLATADGLVQPHPFIQPADDTQRMDWVISPDGSTLAWTLTNGPDRSSLTTITTVANQDGTNPRQLLVDGPRDGIRALPVAFDPDLTTLYMDYQPDGISDFTPFDQFAGLFAVDLVTGETAFLSGEPGCFCGAEIAEGLLLRLAVTDDLMGFDLVVHNLAGQVQQTIPALRLRNYTQAGDILISPGGSHAVYALAQISDFGSDNQTVETVFMLVNLGTMTQIALTDPVTRFLHPVAWTEDDSAILLTSPQQDGTWKITVADGTLTQVAQVAYIGVLQPLH